MNSEDPEVSPGLPVKVSRSGGAFSSVLRGIKGFVGSPAGIPGIILLALLAIFCVLSVPGVVEGFYFLFNPEGQISPRTFVSILNGSILTGIIAIAVVMLMISGEFDLSVGPILAMGGYIFGTFSVGGATLFGLIDIGEPVHFSLAILITLVGCGFLGLINGLVVTFARIPSFIATLGALFIFLWVISLYSGNQSFETLERLPINDIFSGRLRDFNENVTGAWGNLRVSVFWMVGLTILMHLIMTKTKYGSSVLAVGGNPDAAKSQGINVRAVKISGFVFTGVFAGIAGIVLFSQFLRVQANSGNQQELFAIAVAVVGGTLLTGGYGSVLGALVGVLTISTLRSGVILLSTPVQESFIADIQFVGTYIVRLISSDNFLTIVGFTIVAAAVLNTFLRRRYAS